MKPKTAQEIADLYGLKLNTVRHKTELLSESHREGRKIFYTGDSILRVFGVTLDIYVELLSEFELFKSKGRVLRDAYVELERRFEIQTVALIDAKYDLDRKNLS